MKSMRERIKQLASNKTGMSINSLKPNPRELAQRLVSQGALFSIGNGKFKWSGE